MAIIDSLFVRLGFLVDPKPQDEFNESVERTGQLLKKVVFRSIGAATALGYMLNRMGKVANQFENQSKAIGVTTETLRAYQRAAEQLGVDPEKLVGSLSTLKNFIASLKSGINVDKGFLLFLSQIGLFIDDIKGKNPDELFKMIVSSFEKIPDAKKLQVAQLSPFADLLMQVEGRDISELINKSMRNIDYEPVRKFRRTWVETMQAVSIAVDNFASVVLPSVNNALNMLSIPKNIESYFSDLAKIVTGDFTPIKEGYNKQVNALSTSETASPVFDKLMKAGEELDLLYNMVENFRDDNTVESLYDSGVNKINSGVTKLQTMVQDIVIYISGNTPAGTSEEVITALENAHKVALNNLQTAQEN